MPPSPRGAADFCSEDIRARALAHARARATGGPRSLHVVAISAAILLHLLVAVCLYLLMRPHAMPDEGRIEVRLLDATPSEPSLPEPPAPAHAAPAFARMPKPVAALPPDMPPAAPAASPPAVSSAQLFNADGSVHLAPAAAASPHEADLQRGRELMARGHNVLRCARDTLVESVGPTINERAAKAARRTRLLAFATQRSWDIPAQRDSRTGIDATYASDSTIDHLTMIGQDCDDTFYRRPPPERPEPRAPR